MAYWSPRAKPVFLSEDRKVKLISDVDSLVPEKLKNLFFFVEEVVETDEKTLFSVYEKIEKSGESIDYVYSVIESALKIRPFNTKPLLSLLSLLSQKHSYRNTKLNDRMYSMLLNQGIICKQKEPNGRFRKEKTIQEDEISNIFMRDDLESFIKKSSETGFNPKSKIEFDSDSTISFVLGKYVTILSYPQIMAFYGAVKCFKHAIVNDEYDFSGVEEYAVAGGNMEIIHLLEQRNFSFEKCL